MPERLAHAAEDSRARPILFIDARPLTGPELADLRGRGIVANQLAAFDKASTDENFYVYRIIRAWPGT